MSVAVRTLFAFAVLTFAAPAFAQGTDELATQGYNAEAKGDFASALKLYRQAGLAGNAYAQGNLAGMMHDGRGTPRDFTEAMRWYKKAADQSYPPAQFGIGSMYEQGEGVKQDFVEAAKWYRLAADQGFAPAQVNLATLYASGTGVAPDRVEAYVWFSIAAEKDDTAKRRRDTLKSRMTPEQVAQADARVKAWKPKEAAKK